MRARRRVALWRGPRPAGGTICRDMMRQWLLALGLLALAMVPPWFAWPPAAAAGQTLPSAVDPGVTGRRLLPPRLPMRELGPIVARDLDCGSDAKRAGTRFTLRHVIIESDLPVGGADPAAYWRPHLGEEVSLGEVCAIARAVAEDYARRSGRAARALIPVQRIAEGMVHIRIAEPGAAAPGSD